MTDIAAEMRETARIESSPYVAANYIRWAVAVEADRERMDAAMCLLRDALPYVTDVAGDDCGLACDIRHALEGRE